MGRWKNHIKKSYDQKLKDHTAYRQRLKDAVYALLGIVCARCGFDDSRALQIDHINGGGKADIQKIVRGESSRVAYHNSILADPEALKKYQILCANCNWIKRCENKEN